MRRVLGVPKKPDISRLVNQPDFDAAETGIVSSWGLSLRRPAGLVLLQSEVETQISYCPHIYQACKTCSAERQKIHPDLLVS